jgi:hypothetical protein
MAGIEKNITGKVTIGGVTYTPATLSAVFSDENDAISALDSLHTQVTEQVQTTKAARAQGALVYGLLRSYLIGQYGKQATTVLGEFGMTAPKPSGAKTLQSKAAGATKRAATRQVRNTMGSVQKKKVKGVMEVPLTAVTTITPAAPSTTGASATTGQTTTAASTAPATPAAVPAPPKPTA